MKVILPSAGYATRMYPLTLNQPKALLSIGGSTTLDRIIEKITQIDEVDQIFIITNNKFFYNFQEWLDRSEYQIPIKILNDQTNSNEDRLGSIGDVNYVLAREKIDDDFMVINSDNLFNFDLRPMYNSFKKNEETLISMFEVESLDIAKQMGSAKLDGNNRVLHFKEKPENPTTKLCSIGIYIFPRKIVKTFSDYISEGKSTDRFGDFLEYLHQIEPTFGHVFKNADEYWYDIGTKDQYDEVNKRLTEV
jgi:glucose-1-phosphate thymidylyltransferase